MGTIKHRTSPNDEWETISSTTLPVGYTAGSNIQISAGNVISATDTTYTAGTGIEITSGNVINNTQTSAAWGNITGTLSNQTDLNTALSGKQATLVGSGTGQNIKTVNGNSLVGSGDISISAGVWGNITGDIEDQNDLMNEFTYKQDTLVSGTNIKTINNTSIMGSGDLRTHPVGAVMLFAGGTAPDGWLMCQGQAVSRTTYSDLFTVIGTTYGTGDDSTTFNLPNMAGNVPVGLNVGDTDFGTLGGTGGEKKHQLTVDELAKHSHKVLVKMHSSSGGNVSTTGSGNSADWAVSGALGDTGDDQAHNNIQPYLVLNYIIKY